MEHANKLSGDEPPPRTLGFWKCWSMSVGVMIGSGIFMLPAVLAPYGSISFLGWLFTSVGAIMIALVLGRLAGRTDRTGGFYIYTSEAFGALPGFLVAWSYWLGIVFATAAISIAFTGYLSAIFPVLNTSNVLQALVSIAIIFVLTSINLKSVSQAASLQLVLTLLKIVPLLVVIALAVVAGDVKNIPSYNPQVIPMGEALATTALLTMWAFLGIEAGTVPAGEVIDAKRTVPRAVIAATLMVAAIYIASTAAVMMLVPVDILTQSNAPFADAASKLGPIGGVMIAIGALVATAGSLNGNILLSGQMPAAVAKEGSAPVIFSRLNRGHAPVSALIMSSIVSIIVLLFNYNDSLVAAFTFLISMSTLATLMPYAVSALAELRYSIANARAWVVLSIAALVFVIIAMAGAGVETLLWGILLIIAGLPIFYWSRVQRKKGG